MLLPLGIAALCGAMVRRDSWLCVGAAIEAEDGAYGVCRARWRVVGVVCLGEFRGSCWGRSRWARATNLAASVLASSRGRPCREETTESSPSAREVVAKLPVAKEQELVVCGCADLLADG